MTTACPEGCPAPGHLDESNVTIIPAQDAPRHRARARALYERRLLGTGYQMTAQARERWYGPDE